MGLLNIHKRRKAVLAGGGATIITNTFIGGIASVTNTATLLAAKLSITDAQIFDFTIIGDDISCRIEQTYTINADAFYGTSDETLITYYIDVDGYCTGVANGSFRATAESSTLQLVYLPNVITIGTTSACYTFRNRIDLDIHLQRCTTFGDGVTNDAIFATSGLSNTTIYAEPTMETINGGGVEGDLAQAAGVGATIVYADSYVANDAISDLDIVSAGGTYLNVDWTAPSSTNGINYYLVFVDGSYKTSSTSASATVVGLQLNTSYDVTVYSLDNKGNISPISNTLTTSTASTYDITIANIVSMWQGEDATDSVGANDGTATSVSYVSGLVGNCMDFTAGTSSKIQVADDNTLSFGNGTTDSAFSISFWIKWNATGTTNMINKRSTSSGGSWEYLFQHDTSSLGFFLRDLSAGANISSTYSFAQTTGTWYHVVGTYGGNSDPKLYLNGNEVGTLTPNGSYVAMENLAVPLTFGRNAAFTSQSLNGYMDETTLWNTELTAGEVSDLYDAQLNGTDILI